jgi:hypothetical protein
MQGNDCRLATQKKNLMESPNIEMQRPCPTPRSLTTFSERDEIQGIAFEISDAIGVGAKENIAKWRINIVCK